MEDGDILRLLRHAYGAGFDRHSDLRDRSNAHREAHGADCTVYPSSPILGQLWPLLAALTSGRRFLEVGCGLGYTAVLMAEAGGRDCRIDTIESEPEHADLAEAEVAARGVAGRVRVLRGRAAELLPQLTAAYDVVFIDAGPPTEYLQVLPHLIRLTRPGGMLVSSNITPERADWNGPIGEYLTQLTHDPRLQTFIIPYFWKTLSYRLPGG